MPEATICVPRCKTRKLLLPQAAEQQPPQAESGLEASISWFVSFLLAHLCRSQGLDRKESAIELGACLIHVAAASDPLPGMSDHFPAIFSSVSASPISQFAPSNRHGKLLSGGGEALFRPPNCLPFVPPVYLYLKFTNLPFKVDYNLTSPDSDKIPYVECGEYVAYNNENGGVIETLKEDGIVDLDTEFESVQEWTSVKEMVCSWLADAIKYELWVGTDATSAQTIYCSDLPWPIGKVLFRRQVSDVKQQLGITKDNAAEVEEQIYNRASIAFEVLSTKLADRMFLYGSRPSSLDAVFLNQALIALQTLPETSVLRSKLSKHKNLVEYASRMELFAAGTSSSVLNFYANPASSALSRGPSNWGSTPKTKPNKEKAKEERDFKAKRFFRTRLFPAFFMVIASAVVLGPKVELEDDKGFFELRMVKLT